MFDHLNFHSMPIRLGTYPTAPKPGTNSQEIARADTVLLYGPFACPLLGNARPNRLGVYPPHAKQQETAGGQGEKPNPRFTRGKSILVHRTVLLVLTKDLLHLKLIRAFAPMSGSETLPAGRFL
jgi:hypothetical protein